jgi:hypothetical protein
MEKELLLLDVSLSYFKNNVLFVLHIAVGLIMIDLMEW